MMRTRDFDWYERAPGDCYGGDEDEPCSFFHVHKDGSAVRIPPSEVPRLLRLFPAGRLEQWRVGRTG